MRLHATDVTSAAQFVTPRTYRKQSRSNLADEGRETREIARLDVGNCGVAKAASSPRREPEAACDRQLHALVLLRVGPQYEQIDRVIADSINKNRRTARMNLVNASAQQCESIGREIPYGRSEVDTADKPGLYLMPVTRRHGH